MNTKTQTAKKTLPLKTRSSDSSAQTQHRLLLAALSLLLMFTFGCGAQVDSRISALREKFVTLTAIAGETSVSSVLETLKSEDAEKSVPVVLRGQITAGDMPPFETGQAAFVLTDTTGHDGDEEHNPHTCPFCSRNIQDYMANVYFRNDQGQPVDIDSRDLFDLKEKQTVIIQGTGSLGADGTLEVDATKLYVRQ